MTSSGGAIRIATDEEERRMEEAARESRDRREKAKKAREARAATEAAGKVFSGTSWCWQLQISRHSSMYQVCLYQPKNL
jgi:hypothetical protein